MTEKIAFSSHVGHKYEGHTLLDFLTKRFTYFSKEQWLERVQRGDVLINNSNPENLSSLLRMGDEVKYLSAKHVEPVAPKKIPILYEDEDLLIVNKPPHLAVHPGGKYLQNTLINILKLQRQLKFIVLSHRLDRETSGVCVLSKTKLAKDKMYWQFFEHKVEKTYLALVWGRPEKASGLIDAPIGDSAGSGSKIRIKKIIGGANPLSAKTKYRVLSTTQIQSPVWAPPPWPSLGGRTTGPWPISLIECQPITGRTNQIRVHMAYLGCGIVGEKLYDPDEQVFMSISGQTPILEDGTGSKGKFGKFINISDKLTNRLIMDHHALHAQSLTFRHPRTSKLMTFSAPPPKTWQGLYKPA